MVRVDRQLKNCRAAICGLALVFTQVAHGQTAPISPTEADVSYSDCQQCTTVDCAVMQNMCLIDLYAPSAGALGTVIWIHGGSWVSGGKNEVMAYGQPLLKTFTDRGYLVAVPNFRLSSPPPPPQQQTYADSVTDIATAVAWLKDYVEPYLLDGVETQDIRPVLIGYSSGAHLVSLLSTDQSYSAQQGWSPTDIAVTAALDVHAYDIPYAMDLMKDSNLINNIPFLEYLFGATTEEQSLASPASHVPSAGAVPPTFLVSTGAIATQPTRSNGYVSSQTGQRYADILQQNGQVSEHHHYASESHFGLAHQFGLDGHPPSDDFFAFLDLHHALPSPSIPVHIGDVDGASLHTGGNWLAEVAVIVEDANHIPVPYATVKGSWISGLAGTDSCVTDSNGFCTVTSSEISTGIESVTFAVGEVTNDYGVLAYNVSADHDNDGDSSGNAIRIYPDGRTESPDTPTAPVPQAPTNLAAKGVSSSRIDLTWAHSGADELGFHIERSAAGQDNWSRLNSAGANSASYTDANLNRNTTYDYRVVAFNISGEATSFVASGTTHFADLFLNTNSRVINGNHYVGLGWRGLSQVDIYRDGTKIASGYSGSSYFDILGKSAAASYQYQVCEPGGWTVCSDVKTTVF